MTSFDKQIQDPEDKGNISSENEHEEIEFNEVESTEDLLDSEIDKESKNSSNQEEVLDFKDASKAVDQEKTVDTRDELSSRSQKNVPKHFLSYGLIGVIILGVIFLLSFTLFNDSEETKAQASNALQSLYLNHNQDYLKDNITQQDFEHAEQSIKKLNYFNRRTYENDLKKAQEKYELLQQLDTVFQSDQVVLNGNDEPLELETLSLQADTSVDIIKQLVANISIMDQDPMLEDLHSMYQHALTTLDQIEQVKELVNNLPTNVSTRAELPEAVEIIKQIETKIEGIDHHPQMERVNQQLLESATLVGQVFIAGADLGDYDSALEEAFYDSNVLSRSLQGSALDHSPLIALTFDDGPNEDYTTQLLDVLAKHDVKATFFVMGAYVDEFPEVARRIVEEGHVIANHTYNHHDLSAISDEEVLIQFEWTQDSIMDATGVLPDTYRLPFGAGGKRVIDLVPEMTSILWNVDSMDWESHDVEVIYDHIMNHLQHHTLLLMHDTHQATPDTIDLLIPELKDQGYSFVMPEELDFDMRYFAE